MSTVTTQPIATGTWKIDTIHSHVEDGAPRLEGSVNVDSIVVKDENLAAHLKAPDFFDSANYPQISFRSSDVRVGDGGALEVEG